MFSTNLFNINRLKSLPTNSSSTNIETCQLWMDFQTIKDNSHRSWLYHNICQQHRHESKWILMINPEDETLQQLAKQHNIDVSKILRVNTRSTKISLRSIEKALRKGNCSAIVLSGTNLKQEEISQLTSCAQQGKTQCIVLKDSFTLH